MYGSALIFPTSGFIVPPAPSTWTTVHTKTKERTGQLPTVSYYTRRIFVEKLLDCTHPQPTTQPTLQHTQTALVKVATDEDHQDKPEFLLENLD